MHEVFGHLQDAAIHCQVVVSGSDDEIHPADQPLLLDLVVMEECATRRFTSAHTFGRVRPRHSAHVLGENLRIVQDLLQAFDAVQDLDQACVMVVEWAEDSGTLQFVKLCCS